MALTKTYRLPYAITIIFLLILSAIVIGWLYKKVTKKEQEIAELTRGLNELNDRVDTFRFVETMKTITQVTAYSPSKHSKFANGLPVAAAVSPSLERAGYRLGKLLFLRDRRDGGVIPIRIVDRTSPDELRPVVDLMFTNNDEARRWGRKTLELVALKETR